MRDSQSRVPTPSLVLRIVRIARPIETALVAALTTTCACGGALEAGPDESAFLAVGADPVAMIDDATARLVAGGFVPTARIDGERFCAAAFQHSEARSAIRIATRRGMALALDAGPDEGVLSLDPRTGTDLDGDDAPDIVIVRAETARSCLALAGVDPEGLFRPVPTDARGLDPQGCIERLEHLDHDARVEAIVVTRAHALGAAPPSIAEPLTLRADGAFARGAWPAGFATRERETREAALDRAAERGDATVVIRLAVELAWIARARGGDVAAVDEQLALAARVALSPEDAAALAAARQFLLAAVPSPADVTSSASASASE